jgi:hypothetical protein
VHENPQRFDDRIWIQSGLFGINLRFVDKKLRYSRKPGFHFFLKCLHHIDSIEKLRLPAENSSNQEARSITLPSNQEADHSPIKKTKNSDKPSFMAVAGEAQL